MGLAGTGSSFEDISMVISNLNMYDTNIVGPLTRAPKPRTAIEKNSQIASYNSQFK